jgi:hypothetical protein
MDILKITEREKKVLLDFLGYKTNKAGIVISKDTGKSIFCPYTKEPVKFNKASIMPGSTVIFNTDALTLSEYFTEYVDKGECECKKTVN